MKDIFMDLVRCVNSFQFEAISVIADEEGVKFAAVTPSRSLIMKGTTKKPIDELRGAFGLSNLSVLQGILGFTAMKDSDATIEVVNVPGKDVPGTLVFKTKSSSTTYRLMSENAVPDQPKFMAPVYDVTVEPTKSSFVEFKEQAGVFASVGDKFKPQVTNDKLLFELGDIKSANHNSQFAFAETSGVLPATYMYPIAETLNALALINIGSCKVHLSSRGVMQIDIDTGLIDLQFIFPGNS